MGDRSKIEWTNSTWNPTRGCNCLIPEVLSAPLRWKKPRRIFVDSMSDLFHEQVPDEFIEQVFAIMARAPQHTFQILTKRPERMSQWVERFYDNWCWPESGCPIGLGPLPHIWLGVSCEDQPTADERIPWLLQTPAAVRFISYEPALGPVDLGFYLFPWHCCRSDDQQQYHGLTSHRERCWQSRATINWAIAGGESGLGVRPAHPDWFRSVRDQCVAAQVPFYFKQWGEWTWQLQRVVFD